jgi:hypothetical protein
MRFVNTENPLGKNGKSVQYKWKIRSLKLNSPLFKIKKIHSVKWKIRSEKSKIHSVNRKIRSAEMENPLGKNEKSAR